MVFEQEAAFETALINLLTEKYGWEPEILRHKTEEDLIQNWKHILFENNRDVDRLNDVPLTDGEMQQILDQIARLRTPLKLNGFINGKTVAVKRDNPADELHFGKEVSLKIYDRQEIAAGQSRYQIAEQPVFKARNSVLPNRRGDFMLLINGMPLIHCELKRSGVDVSQAYNQIKSISFRLLNEAIVCRNHHYRCFRFGVITGYFFDYITQLTLLPSVIKAAKTNGRDFGLTHLHPPATVL